MLEKEGRKGNKSLVTTTLDQEYKMWGLNWHLRKRMLPNWLLVMPIWDQPILMIMLEVNK